MSYRRLVWVISSTTKTYVRHAVGRRFTRQLDWSIKVEKVLSKCRLLSSERLARFEQEEQRAMREYWDRERDNKTKDELNNRLKSNELRREIGEINLRLMEEKKRMETMNDRAGWVLGNRPDTAQRRRQNAREHNAELLKQMDSKVVLTLHSLNEELFFSEATTT